MDDGLEDVQSILSETRGGGGGGGGGGVATGSDESHENIAAGGTRTREAEEVSSNHIGSDQESAKDGRAPESKEGNNGGGASIIKNLISNILHPHIGGEGGDKSVPVVVDNLPTFSKTIGDSVPEAEEASLLIHSIVHD